MQVSEMPEGSRFLDVEGIPVALLPTGRCVAFSLKTGEARPYPNEKKAGMEGDDITRVEFAEWLSTGFNRFDLRPGP